MQHVFGLECNGADALVLALRRSQAKRKTPINLIQVVGDKELVLRAKPCEIISLAAVGSLQVSIQVNLFEAIQVAAAMMAASSVHT